MGIDWCRMYVREGVNQAELAALLQNENRAFCESHGIAAWVNRPPSTYYKSLPEPSEEEKRHKNDAAALYEAISNDLDMMIVIVPNDDKLWDEKFPVCQRVYGITYNDLFPPEWRLKAYRTFLPEQLPVQVEIWQAVVNAVREGGYSGYLFQQYLYEQSHYLHELWQDLRGAAEMSQRLTNAWTQKERVKEILPRMFAAPEPFRFYSKPVLEDYRPDNRLDYQADPRYAELRRQCEELRLLAKDWNRRVASRAKTNIFRWFTPYDEYISNLTGYAQSTLDWLTRCCDVGQGVYLDY